MRLLLRCFQFHNPHTKNSNAHFLIYIPLFNNIQNKIHCFMQIILRHSLWEIYTNFSPSCYSRHTTKKTCSIDSGSKLHILQTMFIRRPWAFIHSTITLDKTLHRNILIFGRVLSDQTRLFKALATLVVGEKSETPDPNLDSNILPLFTK